MAYVLGQRGDRGWEFNVTAFAFRPAHLTCLDPEVTLVRALADRSGLSLLAGVQLERVVRGQVHPDAQMLAATASLGARLRYRRPQRSLNAWLAAFTDASEPGVRREPGLPLGLPMFAPAQSSLHLP